jgi:N-acetylglucosaminyl-diphospho-decaprenol L-rhamnosyltransferase
VIATRDRRDRLERVLARLASLPEKPPVVVVDNGSRDGTPTAVERSQARLIRLHHDLGAAARTVGVRALDTDAVAFCDDDSWWEPGSLARAVELMRAHPRLAVIAARILVGPENRLDPVCGEMAHSPIPTPAGLPGRAVLGFVACGSVVRRAAYLAVGGFERRLGIGGEEELLALDLAAAGWQLQYVEELVAHHHPALRPGGDPTHVNDIRNAIWSAWLRRSRRAALSRTAALAAVAIRARRPGLLATTARGMPWVLRERRVVPLEVERAARTLDR